jgi:hypothetical protein
MKKYILGLLIIPLVLSALYAQEVKVSRVASGTNYSSIAYDGEGNLWVGTTNAGLYKGIATKNGFDSISLFSSNSNFNTFNIKSIEAPTINGRTSVWVSTNGRGGGTAATGGVYEFATTSTTEPRYYMAERNKSVAKGMGLAPMKNDGLPSRHSMDIAIDKYGSVWSAHSYHDFTMADGFNSKYIVTPGGLGRKPANKGIFDNLSEGSMPYPAYTVNPPVNKSAQTRRCLSVAAGNDQVWMGYAAYEIDGGGDFYAGIAKFDLGGNLVGFLNGENTPELPFTNSFSSPMAYSIHFQKNGDPWIAFNRNEGFAVRKNFIYSTAEWIHVNELLHYNKQTSQHEQSAKIPAPISFNLMPGLIASAGKRVFLGTTSGLLVYDGKGDIRQDSSYTLITITDGLSSNNIQGVTTGGGYVYVTTDQGVDQIFIPSDLSIFHVADKKYPFDNNDGKNYEEMVSLASEPLLNNISFNDTNLPIFSADGTTSSVFRYYTDDFDGFYTGQYLFGVNNDYEGADTLKHGRLILKPFTLYEDDKKEYVDFIYRHPMYVDPQFTNQKEDAVYSLIISKKHSLSEPLFHHKIKISLPPVLFVHGVWSSVESLVDLENGFRTEANYQPFKTMRIYKQAFGESETLYPGDAHHIPSGIKRLIANCKANNMSAGKVNLIVHSRGGLYSRAYIEEIQSNIKYDHDIHALVTLNTPHAGSQLANLVLDDRNVVLWKPTMFVPGGIPQMKSDTSKLGDLFGVLAIPPADQGPKNGATVLRVDQGFITELNQDNNLSKIREHHVPVHAVAATFSFCQLRSECTPPRLLSMYLPDSVSVFNKAYQIYLRIKTPLRQSIDDFFQYIFDGETNDFIVPKSSMEAGLANKYVSRFEGENIAHTPMFKVAGAEGVTTSPVVRARVIELLAQNVLDPESNFTMNGYDPPRGTNALKYNFFKDTDTSASQPAAVARMNDANEDLMFYLERLEDAVAIYVGDTIQIRLITNNIDEAMISFESPNSVNDIYLNSKEVVGDTTLFKFVVPENYYGNFSVISYGFRNNQLIAMDEIQIYASVKLSIQLQDIYFDSYSSTIEILETEKASFLVSGLYSDSVVRNITEMKGVSFYLTNNTVAKITDNLQIQGLQPGYTYLVASYENKYDSLQILVFEYPDKEKTILGEFYVAVDDKNVIYFDWSTIQEFRMKEFVIELSSDSVNFSPYHTVSATGTSYEQKKYSYKNTFEGNESQYFRIRFIDSLDSEDSYTVVRTIVASGAVTSYTEPIPAELENGITLHPNPSSGQYVNMGLNGSFSDTDAEVNIINMNGMLLSSKKVQVSGGQTTVQLPEYIVPGVYIVQLKTSKGIFSKKLMINK